MIINARANCVKILTIFKLSTIYKDCESDYMFFYYLNAIIKLSIH